MCFTRKNFTVHNFTQVYTLVVHELESPRQKKGELSPLLRSRWAQVLAKGYKREFLESLSVLL